MLDGNIKIGTDIVCFVHGSDQGVIHAVRVPVKHPDPDIR